MALFRAKRMSQAAGFSGPRPNFQVSSARTSASCTASSARAIWPTPRMRTSEDTTDRPNLDRTVLLVDGAATGDLDSRLELVGLDEGVASHEILRLGIRAVRNRLCLCHAAPCRPARAAHPVPCTPRLGEPFEPRLPLLHVLLHLLG